MLAKTVSVFTVDEAIETFAKPVQCHSEPFAIVILNEVQHIIYVLDEVKNLKRPLRTGSVPARHSESWLVFRHAGVKNLFISLAINIIRFFVEFIPTLSGLKNDS